MKLQVKSIENRLLIITFMLLFLTFIPRFYDIMKFLPDYSIDENDVVEFAVGFMGGDLDPHWYAYGPLYAYLLSIVYFIQSIFHSHGFESFVQDVFFNPTGFYYTARFINSCLNILLAFLTYKIAKKYFNSKIALMSLFLAIFPFFDRLVSFKIRIDTLLAVLAILTVYFSLKIFETGKLKYYLSAALFFGLGLATKPLPALLILPTIFLSHFGGFQKDKILTKRELKNLKKKKKRKQKIEITPKQTFFQSLIKAVLNLKIYIFLISGVIVNFIFNPYSLLNFEGYINEQIRTIQIDTGAHYGPGWDITRFLGQLGYVFVIISIIAICYFLYKSIKKKNFLNLIFASYPIIYWLAFAKVPARNYFYVTIIPFLIIFVSKSIFDISEKLKEKNIILSHTFIYISLFLIIFQPAMDILANTIRLNSFDNYKENHTTLAGKKWIEENIPKNSKILYYGYYVNFPRLVDFNANEQAQYGEYFMYYRWNNQFLKEQFAKAHFKYLRENKPTFDLELIRQSLKGKEKYLFKYCEQKKIDYMITYHDLTKYPEFEKKIFKKFNRDNYSFGSKFIIYKMKFEDKNEK